MRYSGFRIIKEALTGHKGWTPAWRDPEPQSEYDIIVVGGGGHGLATAYYLAKEFGEAPDCCAGKGLDRRRQCGAEHDHHPLELSAGRE